MKTAAKLVAEWARKIPKRNKPWSASQLAVQQKRAQEQLALNMGWFSKSRSERVNDQLDSIWDDSQYIHQARSLNNSSWLVVP